MATSQSLHLLSLRRDSFQFVNGGAKLSCSLEELREARELTQTQLAQVLQVSQGAVSKVEGRADMHISTLGSSVRAIDGAHLQIRGFGVSWKETEVASIQGMKRVAAPVPLFS